MPKLLLATNNQGKIRELAFLISSKAWEHTTPAREGVEIEVRETGKTFEENATIKALAYAKASNLVAIADDSGIEVEALNGEPGVLSARYAGEKASDRERADHLLAELAGVPWEKRSARFRCVIAIATPEGEVELCSGECRGFIALESRGENGFGYDPIFYLPEFGRTMAELSFEEKNGVSHRGKAAREARLVLERLSRK
ncbi:XTP/dITP diphosphatase [Dehalococcoidia bacterium]|nr:XTP/dITP diphosphatase [Dehalococcoidia bacterium]